MKKLLLTLLTLTLFILLFSAQARITVSAAENSSSDRTTIKVSAKNGSDISDKLREALINARDLAESSGQDYNSQGQRRRLLSLKISAYIQQYNA